ncbi:MAG: DUF3181 family protein [Prochlorothrix sp.]|nr:DUF3181 family protein [Prochlorothrix sp.]
MDDTPQKSPAGDVVVAITSHRRNIKKSLRQVEASPMTSSASSQEIEALAALIGEVAYLDVAKWHLYLNDAKLHLPLAEHVYPLLADDRLTEASLNTCLRDLDVAIGAGQRHIPLVDLLPRACVADLYRALEDYQRLL